MAIGSYGDSFRVSFGKIYGLRLFSAIGGRGIRLPEFIRQDLGVLRSWRDRPRHDSEE